MVKRYCSYGLVIEGMIILGMIFYGFGALESKMITEKKILESQRKINRLKSLAVMSIQVKFFC